MFSGGLELLAIPAFIIGVLFLYKGSDILVDGTVKTAAQLGISALIISVLLVGFGTSSPEFAISVGAAAQETGLPVGEQTGISLGNIIGSCIANLLLVLGISSFVRPIKIKRGIIRREVLILVGATIVLVVCAYFSILDKYHIYGGILFIILFALFVWFFICCARKERVEKKYDTGKTTKNILLIILGIAGVIVGAWLLIGSAVTIATLLDIHPFIIALSMVAIGTSLPELVVSAMAAYKGESDVAVGNVLGSNVFNVLLILGFAALFIPLGAKDSMVDMLILLGVTLFMVPILCTNHTISRKEGLIMLVIYGIYIWYIFFGRGFISTLM